ncbi:hypothetical protein KAX14_04470, partial [Candidatus Bipolaricaulota bacterium]|nr:hypothetical protein [Candidatus Bipolaricaulota bacterium]
LPPCTYWAQSITSRERVLHQPSPVHVPGIPLGNGGQPRKHAPFLVGVSQFTFVELEGHKPYFTNHGLTLIDADLGPLSWLCPVISLSVYIRVHPWLSFVLVHPWLRCLTVFA